MNGRRSLLLVSTCGTSILTNNASDDERRWLTQNANAKDLLRSDFDTLDRLAQRRKKQLDEADPAERRCLSAELNGIAAVLERWPATHVVHYLVQSDTAVGKRCAELVANTLPDNAQVQMLSAGGLRTDDPRNFKDALAELTKELEGFIPGYRESQYDLVFNLTGGWKSVNAYLQAIGMLYADRCVFLFEGAPQLMEIPRLPVGLDETKHIETHLCVFRKLAVGYRMSATEAHGVAETLLTEIDGEVVTSVWGDVVWQRVRKSILPKQLCDPLSPKLMLSEGVRRKFAKLEPERKVQVNEALDELSVHLDTQRPPSKAHTFKSLKGNPALPSTHELYLWSDGTAARLLGHYEGEKFHADAIVDHL